MKKTFPALLFCLSLFFTSFAQQHDTIPPYQKDSTIPAFSILQIDSTWFNKEALPKNKPVVIIYFNPECGHCQLTANEFENKMDELKNVFFVWVSYDSLEAIRSFAYEYNLPDFKNVRIGRDPKYYVPSFFKVRYTPFIAVYNKEGKLIEAWDGGTDPDTIYRLLQKHS